MTTRRSKLTRARPALKPLPPLPEPFATIFQDVLTEKDRRELRAMGMTGEDEIEFLDRIVLDALGEMCVEEARKRGEAKRK